MLSEISELTIEDLFSKSIIDFQEQPAYSVVGKESISYKEVGDRTERLVDLFNKSGLEKGSRISILGNNMPNWPVSYFAITTSSRIAVPILPDFTAFEIVNILEHSGCKALIVSKKLEYKIPEHIFNELDLVISMDELEIIKHPQKSDYVVTSSPEPSDLASIIYTSGTTGTSKGVMLSHSNIVSQEYMTNKLFGIIKEDILLSVLPLSHTYECSIGMIQPFAHGAHVVYMEGAPTPSLLLPALKEVKPTIMLTVPLIVEKIFKNKIRPMFTKNFQMQVLYSFPLIRRLFHKISGKKLYNTFGGKLRFFGIGGSKLDGMVERFLADAGFPYAIGYGLTETSPLLAGAIPGKTRWQSTGPALVGVELRLDNINSKNIGEIVVKGANVMVGYYKDPEATSKCFTADGWFRTKDLGIIDKHGYLYIKGRVDNMILNSNGENIYPEEIETVLNEHDMVLESLVTQKNGKMTALVHFNYDQIEAIHQLRNEPKINIDERVQKIKEELLDFVNDRVSKSSKISEIIEQPVAFEKTATQKIKRYLYTD